MSAGPTGPASSGRTENKRLLIVQKYGGSSLAKPEQIQAVAEGIAELRARGHSLVVVVSAMGKTTDQLVDLAYAVSSSPDRRELDMLLSTGERISMALMSMALNDRACPAISFTGSQAGVLTDELHSNARIVDVRPVRVEAELAKGHVVVLAGFQGVSPLTKEITTLGRGGSDTTAVAMAAHFRAERCEIRKDVDGVHSADPHKVKGTEHLSELHYSCLLDMTFWGAKVLHYRSVELAALLKIPVLIGLAHGDGPSTLISDEVPMYEKARILSVNAHKEARWLVVRKAELSQAFSELSKALQPDDLPPPQLLDSERRIDGTCAFLVTAPTETLQALQSLAARTSTLVFDARELSTVTATCQGAYASPLPEQIAAGLAAKQIEIEKMLFGAMSVTVVVTSENRDLTVQSLHDLKV